MTSSGPAITTIGFDADDTLWQNETFFRMTEQRFTELLSEHGDHHVLSARLLAAEPQPDTPNAPLPHVTAPAFVAAPLSQ